MKYRLIIAASLAGLALTACGQQERAEGDSPPEAAKPKPAEMATQYSLSEDAAGDYAPLQTVKVGDWTLEHIFIAGPHSFENWVSGNTRQPTQAPLTMVFSGNNGELTVAPARFDVSDSRVRFDGSSPVTGDYRFDGRIDLDALATARRTLGYEGAVLKGSLKIGGQTFDNLSLKIKTGG